MTPLPPTDSDLASGMPASNRFRILIVDDLPQNRQILSQILMRVGYDVEAVSNGDDALLRVACQPRPDLIVTDVEMPGMDGIAIVTALRQMPEVVARIPVIAASGSLDPILKRDMMLAGADAFLAKPVDIPLLLETAGRLIRQGPQRKAESPVETTAASVNRLPSKVHG
ncbi:MAG: response regulator [Verrucomicrobiales bacterium]|nr:response regulator [Verrucomicrobiales bacterium]